MTICVTSVSVVYLNRKFVNGKIPWKNRFPDFQFVVQTIRFTEEEDLLKFGLVDTLEEEDE